MRVNEKGFLQKAKDFPTKRQVIWVSGICGTVIFILALTRLSFTFMVIGLFMWGTAIFAWWEKQTSEKKKTIKRFISEKRQRVHRTKD